MKETIDTALFIDDLIATEPDPNKWDILLMLGGHTRYVAYRGVLVKLHTVLWYQQYNQVETQFTDTNPSYLLNTDWLIPNTTDLMKLLKKDEPKPNTKNNCHFTHKGIKHELTGTTPEEALKNYYDKVNELIEIEVAELRNKYPQVSEKVWTLFFKANPKPVYRPQVVVPASQGVVGNIPPAPIKSSQQTPDLKTPDNDLVKTDHSTVKKRTWDRQEHSTPTEPIKKSWKSGGSWRVKK